MKLRQLEFVCEIARSGSFSQAAENCNATQPTLSNAVAHLEEELGAKIFRRTTRSVVLTPFGSYILPYLEAALDASDEVKKAGEAFLHPEHKILRIGLSPLVDMALLNDVLQPYKQENPDIEIYFKECLLDDLGERLANGTVDIAVIPRDMIESDWDHLKLYSDVLCYLPSDGADVPRSGSIAINDLPQAPIIMTGGGCGLNRSLELLFAQNGANFTAYPGAAISYSVIEQWAGLGIGAGILPKAKLSRSADRVLELFGHDDQKAVFDFHWAWLPGLKPAPHIADLHSQIRSRIPAIVSGRSKPPKPHNSA